jgi:hypothetical protein
MHKVKVATCQTSYSQLVHASIKFPERVCVQSDREAENKSSSLCGIFLKKKISL